MSEWITTGQMIDRLKVGEVAENERGLKVTKILNGNIIWESSSAVVNLFESTLHDKWRILPKYVTFEEAMKAVKEGKKVKIHYPDGEHDFVFNNNDYVILNYTKWGELLESKWQIIE